MKEHLHAMNFQYEGKDHKGIVLRMERSSIHDGTGFRTVVFMKGCHLRCAWCSTPESQPFEIQTTAEGQTYGEVMTVEEVLKEVRKDIPFYFHSGGGMTVSGGEMMAQPDFARCLLQQAQKEGINTAIETALFAKWTVVESILRHVDTAYIDIKFVDPELHRRFCGVDNRPILSNLLHTNSLRHPFRLIVRTPLIPGLNDSEAELHRIGQFCTRLKKLDWIQLLPYHKLGTDTYRKLGIPYALGDIDTPSPEHMEACRDIVAQHLERVVW